MKLIPEEFLSIKDKLKSKLKETKNGCLEWTGTKHLDGYGVVYGSKNWSTKYSKYLSHRVFFFLETQIQPNELNVCHKCDNPPCCNPKHLFLGTQRDNNVDRSIKGRTYRSPPFQKSLVLTKDVFEIIRSEYQTTDISLTRLAKKYGIARSHMTYVFRRNNVEIIKRVN